jgi:metal-sulfur cluster biosynthetic enzyme
MSSTSQLKLTWDAEKTHPHLVDPVKDALRKVVDPEIGLNVIELGLIRNVKITNQEAHVHMIMTTPFCPYAPALLEMTRQKAEIAIGQPTQISMGMEPWDPSMMEEGAGSDWGLF